MSRRKRSKNERSMRRLIGGRGNTPTIGLGVNPQFKSPRIKADEVVLDRNTSNFTKIKALHCTSQVGQLMGHFQMIVD